MSMDEQLGAAGLPSEPQQEPDGQFQQHQAQVQISELVDEEVDASLALNYDPDTYEDALDEGDQPLNEDLPDSQPGSPGSDHAAIVEPSSAAAAVAAADGQEPGKRPAEAEAGGSSQPAKRAAVPCEVCGEALAKYCCPGCQCRTCSLACSKQHKVDRSCDGKRDRLAFVPIDEFTDRHLLSDYKLLEEIARADDVAKRVRPPAPKAQLPQHLANLVYQAERRRIKLLIMPPGMHRRRSNTTRYDSRQRKLSWRVEWLFAAASHRVVDDQLPEDATISEALTRHLTWVPGSAAKQAPLAAYTEAGVDKLKVFMRKERTPANAPAFYAVDIHRPLGSQLAGKLVVEFPVLVVALPGEEAKYPAALPGVHPSGQGQGSWGPGGPEHRDGPGGQRGRGRGHWGGGGRGSGGRGRGGRRGGGGGGRHSYSQPSDQQHRVHGGGGHATGVPAAAPMGQS